PVCCCFHPALPPLCLRQEFDYHGSTRSCGCLFAQGADGAGRSGSRSRGEQQSVLETYNPVSGRIYAVLIVLGASLALRLVSLAVLHRRPEKQVWSIRRAAQVSGLNCLGFSKGIATYWLVQNIWGHLESLIGTSFSFDAALLENIIVMSCCVIVVCV
uniref:Uncharacterized protein n=1 Tax=Aegilops tauschii subsp. strangulata TaxID=200361 RepID=A0A453G8V8_AEGTS